MYLEGLVHDENNNFFLYNWAQSVFFVYLQVHRKGRCILKTTQRRKNKQKKILSKCMHALKLIKTTGTCKIYPVNTDLT